MKFGVPLQILFLRTVTWQSFKILQIQNGGRPPYWKSFLAISQRFIVQLTWNLIGRSRITFRYWSRDQNTKIWKFKMADNNHFENGFITLSQLLIIPFQWNLVCRSKFGSKNGQLLKYQNFSNSKWRTTALFVSDQMSAYRSRGCSELIGDVLLFWLLYKDKSAICEILKVRHNINPYPKVSRPPSQQEAQLMLTTGSTRLAVSRGQQTWYHSTCYI